MMDAERFIKEEPYGGGDAHEDNTMEVDPGHDNLLHPPPPPPSSSLSTSSSPSSGGPPPPSSPCPFQVNLARATKLTARGLTRVVAKGNNETPYLVNTDLLVSASPVFEYLIRRAEATGKEEDGKVEIKLDIESNAFHLLGWLMQTSEVPKGSSKYNAESALQLLDVCFRYGMPENAVLVADQLEKEVTPEVAIKVLNMARRYSLAGLEDSALKVILEHARLILSGDEFLQLGSYDVARILGHDELQTTESQVFDAALSWAISISIGSNNVKRSLKYNFSKVFNCIRFPLMSPEELATKTVLAPFDVFDEVDPAELVNLYRYVSLPQYLKSEAKLSPLLFSCKPRKPLTSHPRTIQQESTPESTTNNTPLIRKEIAATSASRPTARLPQKKRSRVNDDM